ncbi:MAG: phosphonate metabolism protein/1,5-bisphosphokinase (PRPP-forming) PhnN [Pseudomonadota bacterium]
MGVGAERGAEGRAGRPRAIGAEAMRKPAPARGVVMAVVGPSGVGKDTLLTGAAAHLKTDPSFAFAQRVITRPARADAEAHEPMTAADFDAAEAAGAFFTSWRAHGVRYGVRTAAAAGLQAGRHVVLNGSRAALAETAARAAALGARIAVIHVTAPAEIVAERLRRRGRESEASIAARRSRPALPAGSAAPVFEVVNDGAVEEGVFRLIAALRAARRLSERARR